MNYIKKLEIENKRIDLAKSELIRLRGFLFSQKFHENPYILNRDVDSEILHILDVLNGSYDGLQEA